MFYFYDFLSHKWTHSQTVPQLARFIPTDSTKGTVWCPNCMCWEKMKRDSLGNKFTGCGRQIMARTSQIGQPSVEWIEVRTDVQKLVLTLIVKYSIVAIPDSRQPNMSFTQVYTFNLISGKIEQSGSRDNVNLYFLPMDLTEKVQSVLSLFSKQIYGVEYLNPLLGNDEKNSLKYLFSFVKNPAAPVFGYLEESFFSEGCDWLFADRTNLLSYNQVCEKIGVKTYDSVRKMIEKKPSLFGLAVFLCQIGFQEEELILKFFDYASLIEEVFGESRYVYNEKKIKFVNGRMYYVKGQKNYIADALAFWFSKAREKYSEADLFNKLIQGIDEDPVVFVDGAMIFHQYFDFLPEDIKTKTIDLGFTFEVHDEILDSIPQEQLPKTEMFRAKQVVEYSPRHQSWEDINEGFVFYLPKNTVQLKKLCKAIKNKELVGRESDVLSQKSVLLWLRDELSQEVIPSGKTKEELTEDEKAVAYEWVGCLEIRKMTVVLVTGIGEELVPAHLKEVIETWARKHNIRIDYE